MKLLHFSSFRQRLNAAFLAVSLVPMLLCSGLLLQIFRLRMTSNAQQTAQQQLSASCEALDTLHPPRIKGPNWSAATGFRALSVSNSASGR